MPTNISNDHTSPPKQSSGRCGFTIRQVLKAGPPRVEIHQGVTHHQLVRPQNQPTAKGQHQEHTLALPRDLPAQQEQC